MSRRRHSHPREPQEQLTVIYWRAQCSCGWLSEPRVITDLAMELWQKHDASVHHDPQHTFVTMQATEDPKEGLE